MAGWKGFFGPSEEHLTYVGKQAKGNPPENTDKNVHGPVDECSREGEQPDQGQEDGYAGDSHRVDEPAQMPGAGVGLVNVVSGDTGDNGGKDELCRPQHHAHKAIQGHGAGCSKRGKW